MKTYAYGFPRLGKNREFKALIEGFWKDEVKEEDLKKGVERLEEERLQTYKKYVDVFPAGEMTLYDHMLDTAILLGVYPRPSNFKEYFDLCRGERALELSKWFNTNYHYLVPEIKSDKFIGGLPFLSPNLNSSAPLFLIGPFTSLKLSKGWDRSKFNLYLEKLTAAYLELLKSLKSKGISAVHLHEPALVLDLTDSEIKAFKAAYEKLGKAGPDILLFTCYESVDVLSELFDLPVKGFGLDLVNGPDNLKHLKETGFPKDKLLIAGIVNGRNVWRTDIRKTLKLLDEIAKVVNPENILISNAAPLSHLPVSLEGEGLEEDLKNKLAFAEERLKELKLIKEDFNQGKITKEAEEWIKDVDKPLGEDKEVKEKVENLKEQDFRRAVPYQERIKIQKSKLALPLFPTTTIGSFPQTKELREKRQAYRSGKLSKEEYGNYIKEKIRELIKTQEDLDLDVLVHGEFERTDMVEFFAEKLKGIATTKKGWIISYGTRVYRPPIIYGDVKRAIPLTLEETIYAQSLTSRIVKGMLTGPVTILAWSFVREDIPEKEAAYQLGLALREEVNDLERAGHKIIQVDEPAFREKMPIKKKKTADYFDWATQAFRLTSAQVKPETQIHAHMCYSEFGEIIAEIHKLDADVISIEASRSRGDILEAFEKFNYDHQIGLGVWDIHSPLVPSLEKMKEVAQRSLKFIPKENFWINPDCGLKTRDWKEVIPSLRNLVSLAQNLRGGLDVLLGKSP